MTKKYTKISTAATRAPRTGPRPAPRQARSLPPDRIETSHTGSESIHPKIAERRAAVYNSNRDARRRLSRNILATAALTSGVIGSIVGITALREKVADSLEARNNRVANAAPAVGETCTVVAAGLSNSEVSPRAQAQVFVDGDGNIVKFSEAASMTMKEHPGEGFGVCDPNNPHVVAADEISPGDQTLVSRVEFINEMQASAD